MGLIGVNTPSARTGRAYASASQTVVPHAPPHPSRLPRGLRPTGPPVGGRHQLTGRSPSVMDCSCAGPHLGRTVRAGMAAHGAQPPSRTQTEEEGPEGGPRRREDGERQALSHVACCWRVVGPPEDAGRAWRASPTHLSAAARPQGLGHSGWGLTATTHPPNTHTRRARPLPRASPCLWAFGGGVCGHRNTGHGTVLLLLS